MNHSFINLLTIILSIVCFTPVLAQQPAPVEFAASEQMVPVRDGVKLYTVICAPKNQTQPLPILMTRTPYGSNPGRCRNLPFANKELVADGYIFVNQDIRGKYKSEGDFMMNRPALTTRDKNDTKAVDESSDTYDAIDWLVKNIPNNNGRVGIFGVSYPGWLSVVPLLEPHPALKALSPQAAMNDTWMGDDFFHQGGFRLAYGYEYVYGVENTKGGDDPTFNTYDMYEWYLKQGALSNFFSTRLPTWKAFIEHPSYDAYWQARSAVLYLKDVTVPTLHVAGWFDQEDFYGPMKAYSKLEQNDKQHMNYLVAGPWNHGGWRGGAGDKLGNIEFNKQATGQYFREKIEAPFFAYHLHGKGTGQFPEAQTFQTGSNEWKSYDQWPPANLTTTRNLYFHANGKLSFDAPPEMDKATGDKAFDSYISDPKHPVPYRKRPIEPTYFRKGSGWSVWLTEDQRFADGRPDVLTWETDTLQQDVTVSGEITAQLFAATSGTDSDWIVKLIDVYPEDLADNFKMGGYQFMLAGEVMRGRYYKGFDKPQPLVPNKPAEFNVYLIHKDHSFKKGHKIMVQVQSTWFPVIDRNPQKYVENIFKATDADYIAATQRIYRSKALASHLKLPVVK
ncbi:MAG: CocE/NonD family hydrolase [Acidobacteria bacterium]|nr:CocE/NonD family hydrolase [Acidobacteriota bacterium]MBI3424653.1 CocE/NonD family hydrolase [Acidobacteriota bacterium]